MSPRTQIQNRKIREESQEKILTAAFNIMSTKGYDSTSIAQIAKEAGVSKGLMYNYFHSKEDLLKALIERTLQDGEKIMEGVLTDDPLVTLENIIRWYFNELRNNLREWRFISEIMFRADIHHFVRVMTTRKLEEYSKLFSALLHEIGFENPIEEAYIIGGLFDGIGFQCMVVGDKYPIDKMEKYLISKYCKRVK